MREMKKGSLGLLVLQLLFQHPSYGYALCERLREESDGSLTFEEGAVYPILHSYEQEGWVEGYWETDEVDSIRKGARRRYYRLTPSGVVALRESLQAWRTFTGAVNHILGESPIVKQEGQS